MSKVDPRVLNIYNYQTAIVIILEIKIKRKDLTKTFMMI